MSTKKLSLSWIGDVNAENFRTFSRQVGHCAALRPRQRCIDFLISSGGGSIDFAFRSYYRLKKLDWNLRTVGTGDVWSMAVILFVTGKYRVATPDTTFGFHELERQFQSTTYSAREIRAALTEITCKTNLYAGIVAENSRGKLTKWQVETLMRQGALLDVSKAKKIGLVDDVLFK